MAKCTVCTTEFSWNPTDAHFFTYVCGKCGKLVGTGCFQKTTLENGNDAIICKNCKDKPGLPNPDPGMIAGPVAAIKESFERSGEKLIDQAKAAGAELLADSEKKALSLQDSLLKEAKALKNEILADSRREADAWLNNAEGKARDLAQSTVREMEKSFERLAQAEIKMALRLGFILAGLVLVAGLVSVVCGWLHKVVL
jgi:vacuolar-type H+-ATPase subunit H